MAKVKSIRPIAITKIHHRFDEWVDMEQAAVIMHCCKRTVMNCLSEMEALVGDRYEEPVTAQIGEVKVIDRLALTDFIRHRKQLKNRNLAKRLEPYNPAKQAKLLGYFDEIVSEEE